MGDETIARASIQLTADGSKLAPEMAAAVAKAQGALDAANRKAVAAQARVTREIQSQIDKINATKPTNDMRMLEQAVLRLGGTSKLSADQLARVTVQVNQLAAAGAKVPATLQGLTGMGSKLGAAFSSLTTGGGVSGALAAMGPAGVAAAAGLGAVTMAGGAAVREIAALAGQAEQWANTAKSTGLGITEVQQLSVMLEDAGIPAEALKKGMKALSDEVAGGGKQLAQFGITIEGWDLMTQEQRLRAMARIIADIEDPATASAVAVAAFGKSGADLIPVMEQVATGAYEMYDALGEGSIAALAQADAQIDAFTRKLDAAKKRVLAGAIELAQGFSFANGIPMWLPNADAAASAAAGAGPKGTTQAETERQGRQAAIERAKAEKEAEATARKAAAESKRLSDERLRQVRAEIDAEVVLLKAREDETLAMQRQADAIAAGSFAADAQSRAPAKMGALGDVNAWEQARYSQAISLAEGAQKAGLGLDQIRQKLEGMGLSAEDAAHVVDTFLKKEEEAKKSTETWGDRLGNLSQQLSYLASVTGGLAGKILGLAASLTNGLGGVLNGLQGFKDAGMVGGLSGLLGKIASGAGIVGSVIGIGSSLIGGIKSLFGGKSREQKEAEAAAKKQAEEEKRQAAIDAAQRRQAAAEQAQGFAQSLSDKLGDENLSGPLKAALQGFVGQLSGALGKFGLGVIDARLKESKGFQAAAGVAGDVAGGLSAAREAGIADAAMIAAAGGAAQEIQNQAIAAAKEAGLSDMEAARQGSLAIAQILRQQLNASIQSGNELDANTRALLEEAKANGIEIMADPMIESLAVQKDILATLRGQPTGGGAGTGAGGGAGAGGGGDQREGGGAVPREPSPYEEYPDYKRRRPVPAASGLGPTMFGANPPPIQPHQGELGMIIPRADVPSMMRAAGVGGTAAPGGGGANVSQTTVINVLLPTTAESERQAADLAVRAVREELDANNARLARSVANAARPHL